MSAAEETRRAAIRKIVDAAPPMSHEMLSNLSVLLGGVPLPLQAQTQRPADEEIPALTDDRVEVAK